MLENEKKSKPNLKGEMDELQRASQDLSRDYGIDVSVKDLVNAFRSSTEETISKDTFGNSILWGNRQLLRVGWVLGSLGLVF